MRYAALIMLLLSGLYIAATGPTAMKFPLMACAVVRRRFLSGCKSHPATVPAGSNRSNCGGNEAVEASGEACRI